MDGHIDILAIESSCDETAAAVVRDGKEVLSNVIYSQIDMHTVYGGVVPELASRAHIEKINYVIQKALDDAGMELKDTDAIAVTYGPGLVGALLVGVAEAKAMDLVPPYLGLIVSGGHTHLVIVEDWAKFRILGRTVDDAAGEAFDKVARAIGLGYPGGPKIDKISKEGNPNAVRFTKAKVNGSEYDFSFSGLKSAVLNYLNQAEMKHEEVNRADLAASFQKSVVDVICEHTLKAAKDYGIKNVAVAGGVASNSGLREGLRKMCDANGLRLFIPSPVYCTDNAVMIGAAAFHEYEAGTRSGWDLNAVPGLRLGEK